MIKSTFEKLKLSTYTEILENVSFKNLLVLYAG